MSDPVFGEGGNGTGVYGHSTGGWGVEGRSERSTGVLGHSPNAIGVHGLSEINTGVYGQSSSGWGVHGFSRGNAATVGFSANGTGVFGHGEGGFGVHGVSNSNTAVLGVSSRGRGVHGIGNAFTGVEGWGITGVFGLGAPDPKNGVLYNQGVHGRGRGGGLYGIGVLGTLDPPGQGWAGYFEGNVRVTGNLVKGGGGFSIDHPRDPANKYLNHSFVESSQMTNFYDGIVTLDEDGTAWVDLPEWFEALNGDFRYQLTAVGGAAPNLHVAEEIYENHRFKVAGKARTKVCWQVTGSRKDAWAAANPIKVEEEKRPEDRGRYLHPHLYNAPQEQRVWLASMEDESMRMMRQGPPQPPEMPSGFKPPQAPEMPPGYVFEMKAEHERAVNELRKQIEELRRSRLEEEYRRQIEDLRRQVEELRRRP